MRRILTTLFLAISLGVTAQDVKIQGPKRQPSNVSTKKTVDAKKAQSQTKKTVNAKKTQSQTKEAEESYKVSYYSSSHSIGYGTSKYWFTYDMAYVDGKSITNSFYIGRDCVDRIFWKSVMGSSPSGPVNNSERQAFVTKLNSMTGCTFTLATDSQIEFINEHHRYSIFSQVSVGEDLGFYLVLLP